ncbi:hypothetical protein DFQ30_009217 [Apophysomyces sp. BC1015]|nr:hypothetical protein DFQ30_009217 [Apophysomyces sp. BC1015]
MGKTKPVVRLASAVVSSVSADSVNAPVFVPKTAIVCFRVSRRGSSRIRHRLGVCNYGPYVAHLVALGTPTTSVAENPTETSDSSEASATIYQQQGYQSDPAGFSHFNEASNVCKTSALVEGGLNVLRIVASVAIADDGQS